MAWATRGAVAGAWLLIACRALPDAAAVPSPLGVDTVWKAYRAHAGRTVTVEGFLIVEGRRHFLLQGARSPPSDSIMEGKRRIDFYCTFQGQPPPLEVHGLGRRDIRSFARNVRKHRSGYQIEGQRATIEGVLRPVAPGTEGHTELIIPLSSVSSGALDAARTVRTGSAFCRGHRP